MIKTVVIAPFLNALLIVILGTIGRVIYFESFPFSLIIVFGIEVFWGFLAVLFVLLPLYKFNFRRTTYLLLGSVTVSIGVLALFFVSPDSQLHFMARQNPFLYFRAIKIELFYGVISGITLTFMFYWLATHNQSLKRSATAAPTQLSRNI